MDPQGIIDDIYSIPAFRNLDATEDVTQVGEHGYMLPVEQVRHDFVDQLNIMRWMFIVIATLKFLRIGPFLGLSTTFTWLLVSESRYPAL